MFHVSAQGVDERTINVHYYYYSGNWCIGTHYSSMEPALTYSMSSPPPPAPNPHAQLLITAVLQIIVGGT